MSRIIKLKASYACSGVFTCTDGTAEHPRVQPQREQKNVSIANPGSNSGMKSVRNAKPELSVLQYGQTGFIPFTDSGFVGFMEFNFESPIYSFEYELSRKMQRARTMSQTRVI